MRKYVPKAIAVAAVLIAGFSAAGFATGTNPPSSDDHRVTICHDVEGNGNTGNGYNIITVDKDSIANKDGSFNGHGLDPNDIIPAFAAGSKGNQEWGAFPGRGDASWIGNNCKSPDETEPPEECPDGDFNGDEDGCGEPPVECPDGDFNGQEPGCGEPPVECPNGDLNGDLPGCDPVQPPGERCPPGMTPTAGKDGEPGNDECEFPPTETVPPVTTTPEPPVVEPPVVTPPPTKPKPPVAKPKPPVVKPKPKPTKPQAKPKPPKKAKPKNGAPCKPKGGGEGAIYKGKCHAIVRGSG